MSFTALLVAASILVPAPMAKQEGWNGQMVVLKHSGVPYRFVKDGAASGAHLLAIDYRVLQDKGDDVLLVENGKEVLVRKDDVVLQSEAIAFFTEMIQEDGTSAVLYAFRGWAYKQSKNLERAQKDYDKAIELAPNQCAWRNNRALVLIDKKEYDAAIADYDEAIKLFPRYALGYRNRGHCWVKKKEYAKALRDFQKAIELGPEAPVAHSSLARLLASCPDDKIRNGAKALQAAKKACEMSAWKNGALLDTLAAAYAELGQFEEAINYQEQAFADPFFVAEKEKADEARQRLQGYREKKPFRDEGK